MKTILLQTVGEEQRREKQVTLTPGTLVTDALEQAGFRGYRAVKPDQGGHFQPAENLYDQVADGQKIQIAKVDDLSAGA